MHITIGEWTMDDRKSQTVIRRSPFASILTTAFYLFFAFLGGFVLHYGVSEGGVFAVIPAVIFISVGVYGFAIGIPKAWKPMFIVSTEGITIPAYYGRGTHFVPWHNVKKIEVMEQEILGYGRFFSNKYIGIFLRNTENIEGFDKRAKLTLTNTETHKKETPDLVVSISFSFVRVKTIIGALQKYRR
jgi:hypothetical protein